MIDKYKVASDLKKSNPEISHKKATEVAKEAVRIYFDESCSIEKAIEKAKEVIE